MTIHLQIGVKLCLSHCPISGASMLYDKLTLSTKHPVMHINLIHIRTLVLHTASIRLLHATQFRPTYASISHRLASKPRVNLLIPFYLPPFQLPCKCQEGDCKPDYFTISLSTKPSACDFMSSLFHFVHIHGVVGVIMRIFSPHQGSVDVAIRDHLTSVLIRCRLNINLATDRDPMLRYNIQWKIMVIIS